MISLPPTLDATVALAAAQPADGDDAALRAVAEKFEAAFLSEMLRHSGLDAREGAFSGGAGEQAFSSFLTRAYADDLARRGGLGLSEAIFNDLKERATPHGT